jgi:NTP pyrophosphatase (non-canonical NTP hydrolase)
MTTQRESNLVDSAYAWWISKRPSTYTAEDHLRNPIVNTTSDAEAQLAQDVARYVKDDGALVMMPIIEKEALDGLQTEIGSWSDLTFPNSTLKTMMLHLRKEVQELDDEFHADEIFPKTTSKAPHEIADCIMLLFHMAHRIKASARDAIREKFEICKKRKWGLPDKDGCVQHVKE